MITETVGGPVSGGTPTGSATVVLLDTFTALRIPLSTFGLSRIALYVTHDQAFTLQLLKSTDGITYDIYANQAVPISAAPDVADVINLLAGGPYLKAQVVNGGTNQTVWRATWELIGNPASPA